MTPTELTVTVGSNDGHTTKSIVERHSDVKLVFEAPEGRTIESVTLDGEAIELNEGVYIIEDITSAAVFYVALNEVEPEVVYVQPEYVNVSLILDGCADGQFAAAKGEDFTVVLSVPEGRSIVSVSCNGEDVTDAAAEGAYIIEAIDTDAVIVVTLNELEPEVVIETVIKEIYIEPEHVNVTLSVGGHATVRHLVAKAMDAAIAVTPSDNWILDSLTLNGEDVTDAVADGVYTIPAASLEDDAELNAVFAYAGEVIFDFTTGVETMDGCDFRVYSDAEDLVIENVPTNARVAVYSTAGQLIASAEAGDNDIVRISLLPGIYVVTVDNVALKIKH